MNPSIFKAYDIRGKYPNEINEEVVSKIISSFISKFKIQSASPPTGGRTKFKIIVAHDARLSSPALYRAAIKSVRCPAKGEARQKRQVSNVRCIKADLTTTPMLYFLVNKLNADFGIMITASHNPKEYNGLKIVGKNAAPISGNEIKKIIL